MSDTLLDGNDPRRRPDLTATATKPDVLVRLRTLRSRFPGSLYKEVRDTADDAADVIAGLRASNELRLQMINELKRELAEARPTEGR